MVFEQLRKLKKSEQNQSKKIENTLIITISNRKGTSLQYL